MPKLHSMFQIRIFLLLMLLLRVNISETTAQQRLNRQIAYPEQPDAQRLYQQENIRKITIRNTLFKGDTSYPSKLSRHLTISSSGNIIKDSVTTLRGYVNVFIYDKNNRPVQELYRRNEKETKTFYHYKDHVLVHKEEEKDKHGKVLRTYHYEYNAYGLIRACYQYKGEATEDTVVYTRLHYTPEGKPEKKETRNRAEGYLFTLEHHYLYDKKHRLTHLIEKTGGVGSVIRQYDYPKGNVVRYSDYPSGRIIDYHYDDKGLLRQKIYYKVLPSDQEDQVKKRIQGISDYRYTAERSD